MYTCSLLAFYFIYYIRITKKNHKKFTTALEYQGNQPKRLQRENEAKDDNIEYNKEHGMIKSFFCWKTHRKKIKYYVMIKS